MILLNPFQLFQLLTGSTGQEGSSLGLIAAVPMSFYLGGSSELLVRWGLGLCWVSSSPATVSTKVIFFFNR